MAKDFYGHNYEEVLRRAGHYTGPVIEESPVASIEERDTVYREFLKRLVLSPRHRENLLKRGLDEDAIEFRQYKSTVGWESSRGLCVSLLKDGYNLKGIPGFFKDRYGNWVFMTLPGFLISSQDIEGRIQGFQIRVDDQYRKKKESGKYLSFSSAGKDDGCSSGSLIHVAVPQGKSLQDSTVWVTEGPLKADIASIYTGVPFLGVPGVSIYKQAAEYAAQLNINHTAVAYDMDVRKNPHVAKAEKSLVQELWSKGIKAVPVSWNETLGKGIDDAVINIYNGEIPIPKDVLNKIFLPQHDVVLEVKMRLRIK
ncbi:MAG: DUF3854 domain-containing protein [Clostridiales bacterium]|nr:DUF3854 domain-containing protein [Clostridiales bacterium]